MSEQRKNFRITVDVTPGTARRIAIVGVTLGVLSLALIGHAATVPIANSFVIGGVLSAKTLNDNFAAVESRLLAVEGMQHDSATVEQCGGADCTNAVSITSSVAWISLISRSSIGNYTVYFPTGHYSKPPTCVVTGNYRGGTGAFCMPAGAAVKTSQSVMCVALQGSGGGNAILLDAPFNIACHGPA